MRLFDVRGMVTNCMVVSSVMRSYIVFIEDKELDFLSVC